jgi:alkanesulfonate monooxygenase SsuD/methylene tetrahydromethanopterin reductase-like flavin-dependent oxidoreductase (luciferase family)
MATVTRHLGFGVTMNLSYEPPYAFARRMSTLDHLTEGRIGWNIVTGYLDSAAGRPQQTAHDGRYDYAEEYMALIYKLWEQSWTTTPSSPTATAACSPIPSACARFTTKPNI